MLQVSRYVGLGIALAYLVPPAILFIPLAATVYQLGLFATPAALIPSWYRATSIGGAR
jgi:multiple sugar transport system permease protein